MWIQITSGPNGSDPSVAEGLEHNRSSQRASLAGIVASFTSGMLFDHTLYLYKSDARKIKASVVKPTNLMLIVAGVCVATLHSSKGQAPAFSTAVHCVILLGRDTGRLF